MIEERLKYTREKPALRKVLALSLTPNNSQPPPKKVLAPAITPNAMNYVAKPVCSGAPSQKLQSHLKPKVSEKNIEISVPKAENEPEKDLIVSRKNSLFKRVLSPKPITACNSQNQQIIGSISYYNYR